MKCTMSVECCETDASYDSKSNETKDNVSNEGGDGAQIQHDDSKLQEMGEALEIAESRCNTLKEQLDQMRHLYREQSSVKSSGPDSKSTEFKAAPKAQVIRQNSESISTDNSGAAVLTINNILNGITNSINRLSELHSYIEPDQACTSRKKSKHTKTQENEFVCETHNPRCSSSRSSSWIFNDKKKDNKRKSKRVRPIYESGSMTQMKKPIVRPKLTTPREEASTTSVKARRKNKRINKFQKKIAPKRPGFNNNLSSNHLVEIYHNTAVDYADSEEMLHAPDNPNHMRTHFDHGKKNYRKQVQMPTISTTECKDNEEPLSVRNDGYRSLSPIKEQETTNMDVIQHQGHHFPTRYFCGRGYQSPTISSRMKQVARSYFRHFSCKSIPFCAAKSTTPSHNIGINIQQVMSIINGRQHNQGISPTLAHNIGLAAERLNNGSFTALVSSFGSRYRCNPNASCPMQCNVNYQHLQEMAIEVPNEEAAGDEARSDLQNHKIEIEITNRKSQETLCWSMDPNSHNNCTCANPAGLGFQQVVEKYQQFSQASQDPENTTYDIQQNMASIDNLKQHESKLTSLAFKYSYKVKKQANKRYSHIRSVYAQYNDTHRRCKKEMYNDMPPEEESGLPMQGKEKILKAVLMNIHDEFSSLSEKYEELSKIVEDENHSNTDNVEKMDALEKKLNEKEMEIQMVMALYAEVVNLKSQLKALKDKLGMSSGILETQKNRFGLYQRTQRKKFPQQQYMYCNNGSLIQNEQLNHQKTSNTCANLHLTKLLRHIQSYREVCKVGGK